MNIILDKYYLEIFMSPVATFLLFVAVTTAIVLKHIRRCREDE